MFSVRRRGQSIVVVACLASVSTVGCRHAALNPAGAQVATSQSAPVDQGYPPAACRSLGYVVGRGGGSFGGGFISNDDLVKYAMNDLQNAVAKLGGNFVQHDTPQLGISGDKNGTTTSTATVSGTAYYCNPAARQAAPVATVAAAPPAKPALSTPPEGAGGFRFGEAAADAQSGCSGAGYAWKRTGSDAECSNTLVPIAASTRAVLHLCQESVCGVELVVAQAADRVVSEYDELYSTLEKKYGIPRQRRADLVPSCTSDLKSCLAGPSAPSGAAWRWPDGNSLEVRLAMTSGTVVVNVTYSNPTRAKATTPGPAL